MANGTKLEKAYLALVAPPNPADRPPPLSSVLGQAGSGGEGEVVFMFNPKEFSISKAAQWQRRDQAGAQRATMPEFTGSQPGTLQLEVFLDKSEEADPSVAADVQRLLDTVTPLQSTLPNHGSPPWVVFGWGQFMSFVAVVKQVNARYTMFQSDGTPIRATCTLTLEEVPTDPPPRQNPTSGALAASRSHRMVDGDSLQSVAQREYGDVSRWRDLAAANGIDDPMRVMPGTELLIPDPSMIDEG
ncbi:MAG: peptidase M23 [Nitriliruptorales bacterium]|nr:peptidase M23 [Nitriliruptorales bacterium]